MLVLSRKTGQKLIIDNHIEVVVLETRGESVKLGIVAPKNVTVFREEIYEEIKKANTQALSETQQTQTDALNSAMTFLKDKTKQTPPAQTDE
jgi:carbon storage regulator